MERQAVKSSNIRSIGFQPEVHGETVLGTLEVEFNNGGVYQYLNVPLTLHQELMTAPSVGAFLHGKIRPCYECRKAEGRAER